MNAIVREWRGRVPANQAEAYLAVLQATGLKHYAATPGHRGTLVLREDQGAETEYVLLTFWESEQAIRAFAGDDIGRAVYYPEDDGYLLEKPERLHHYRLTALAGDATNESSPGGPSPAWPPIAAWR